MKVYPITLKQMRAAIYARVSTADQSCELQLLELREYVARRGWEIAGEYVDAGWSGAKANRPELDRLMADARLRRFDAVISWKLDRFGRSLVNCVTAIQELSGLGIRFLAISQGLDTDQANPTAQLLLHILAAVAQFERELIRERVAAGMKTARAKGKSIGRPKRVFDRQSVMDLRSQGMSYPQIARELNLSQGTVFRAVQALSKKPE
jgi:DNA invertase Pin-like site-specific DNA recombinase